MSGNKQFLFVAFSIIGLILLWFYLPLCISMWEAYSVDRDDPDKDSSNVSALLDRDSTYPYVGLWKENCGENFGLSIDKVSGGLYSVSFCGPSGCFKPGTYLPNTKLEEDHNYIIIDKNTIQVKGKDGFSTYRRCE